MKNEVIQRIADNWNVDAMQEGEKYFYNYNEVKMILSGQKCYVIGRKGMGKSAICRHIVNVKEHNHFAAKLTFKNFPFNEIYTLKDFGYTYPNQYLTLWKYLIYSTVCKMMIKNEGINYDVRQNLLKVFPEDTIKDLSRDIKHWTSVEFNVSLLLGKLSVGAKAERKENERPFTWINKVGILEEFIAQNAGTAKYYIVFDELDEDYQNIKSKDHTNSYIPLLTGLFKAVQSVKNIFKDTELQIYPVVFLRDDIYSQIRDSDKNKWRDLKIEMEWTEDRLKNMLAYRIACDDESENKDCSFKNNWEKIFLHKLSIHYGDRKKKTTDVFDYILKSTQLRPRDFIEYIQCCCKLAIERKENYINERIVLDADRAFSNYMKAEFIDEMYPILTEIEMIFQIFSSIGKWNLNVAEFKSEYEHYLNTGRIKEKNVDFVLETLFDFSVIGNQHKTRNDTFFFKYKQTNMQYHKGENIILHRGLFKALQIL